MARKHAKGAKKPPSTKPEISEEEQWRLIKETGLLNHIPDSPRATQVREEEEETPFAVEILNALMLIAPFTFLLVMMDM